MNTLYLRQRLSLASSLARREHRLTKDASLGVTLNQTSRPPNDIQTARHFFMIRFGLPFFLGFEIANILDYFFMSAVT